MTKNPALVYPISLALFPIRVFVNATAMGGEDLLLRIEIVLDTDCLLYTSDAADDQ